MMKKLFVLFAVAAFAMSSCSESGFLISGTVASDAELDGQYIYLYTHGAEGVLLDSALVTDGSFTFKGVQKTPALVDLRFADGVINREAYKSKGGFEPFAPWFVLDNNARLTVSVGKTSAVEGSAENDELTAHLQQAGKLYGSLPALKANLQNINKLYDNMPLELRAKNEALKKAEKSLEQFEAQVTAFHKKYILKHSNSLTAAAIFYDHRHDLSEDVRREILAQAGETFKSAPNIDKMIEHLDVLEKVAVGKPFSDLELADPAGELHKLSEYAGTGKVVLLDFWASRCPPCRADMPHVAELYKQYKGKGFEIVGLSFDRTEEAWKKGIEELHMTWPQLSDLNYWQSAAATLYGVNSIPHTILVDKDGVIIAKDLRGDSLDAKLAELFD